MVANVATSNLLRRLMGEHPKVWHHAIVRGLLDTVDANGRAPQARAKQRLDRGRLTRFGPTNQ